MKTEEILKLLKENQFKSNSFEKMTWVTQEIWDQLKEVDLKYTNPRRDYLGIKIVYKNNFDEKYFFVEEYADDGNQEICRFKEVKPVEKTVIIYEERKTN